MHNKPLTETFATRAKCPEGRRDIIFFDADMHGFGLRVFATGKRSWLVQYRRDNKTRRFAIGPYPALTAAQARDRAQVLLGRIADGADPTMERLHAQIRRREELATTVTEAIALYRDRHASRNLRRWRETVASIEQTLGPLSDTPLADLTREMILEQLDRRAEESGQIAANRAHAYIRAFLGWCNDRGWIAAVPIDRLKRQHKERTRDHVIKDADLALIWITANPTTVYGAIIRLCILLGQRKGEISAMRWSQLDLERGEWTLTGRDTKAGRRHTVPLPVAVREIIAATPRTEGDFVFGIATNGSRPFSGWSQCKKRLDAVAVTSEQWRVHDLRRTVATGLARLAVELTIIKRILNHADDDLGITAIYLRHGYLDEMRSALERWAGHIAQLTTAHDSKVVRLRSG
jgi:integrase